MRFRIKRSHDAFPIEYNMLEPLLKDKDSSDLVTLYVICCKRQYFGEDMFHLFVQDELQWTNARFSNRLQKLISLGALKQERGNDQ